MKYSRCVLLMVALQFCASLVPDAAAQTRRVNAPYFAGAVGNPQAAQAAVFWFGRVDPLQNYADVRVAYTDSEVWIRVTVFDQWLWHDTAANRTPASLETWDAASLVLDTNNGATSSLSSTSHRFVAELSGSPRNTNYQAAYLGSGAGWSLSPSAAFSTEVGWRGDSPNNSGADRGWMITFHLPYSSLGVSGPPATSTPWRLGVLLHDKDSQASPAVSNQFWPGGFVRDQPNSWGELAFGLRPADTPTIPPTAVTHTIRHGLNGAVVTDAMVGGGANCGGPADFFSTWGANNYAHSTELVVQNQGDVADWPCFSKTYVDFPLSGLPAGKSVVSATLTIYQFGGSDPLQAVRSLVQVLTVAEPWDENAITWNTAPLAVENVAQSWVDVIPPPPPPFQWPGPARTWNVSWAVSQAYSGGLPVLRLALYEADGAYHSGKYFTASETGDWNAVGRPTLSVILADTGPAQPSAPGNLRVVQ